MGDSLTEQQKQEYRDVFKLFDRNGNNTITTKELGTVLRCIGLNPTEAELSDMESEVKASGSDEIDFDKFLHLMNKQIKNEDSVDEILESFKVFDKNSTGEILSQELRHVLTSIGEKLSEEEANNFFREAALDPNGKVLYDDLVKRLMEKIQ
eukprot:TRINITY_DN9658_c0_g1_i1.p1 TRINITY_DN9658_c0_g1~~TRINITY_DN9658_c0_g1_i1.p1  ORF type:complete len:152 (-),score=38.58 TRINITY_DN9658_c0_g1_i1:103-558(-)